MADSCLHCKRALGCKFLYGRDGRFDPARIVTPESKRGCSSFEEVAHREKNVRDWAYKNFGLGYMRTLHELPELLMESLRQGEKDELMYDNMPNFQDPSLLWEGMTSIEREDILRHQTDDAGQIVVEIDAEGVEHKLARPEHHLKAYAWDPDGPIRVPKPVAWMWNVNQVVDHIIKAEAEAGLITKVKKPSAQPAQQQEEETEMPGRPVQAVRKTAPAAPAAAPKAPAKAPAAAAPARAAAPAGRVNPKPPPAAPAKAPAAAPKAAAPAKAPAAAPKAPAAAPKAPVAAPKAPTAAAPSGQGKVSAGPPQRRVPAPVGAPGARPAGQVQPKAAAASGGADAAAIKAIVFDVVNPMIEELRGLIAESIQTTINCATILHDIAGQTGGTFRMRHLDAEGNEVVDELGNTHKEFAVLFPDKNKIFAHVTEPSTAYEPENMYVVNDGTGASWPLTEGGAVEAAAEEEPAEEPAEEPVEEEVVEEEVVEEGE